MNATKPKAGKLESWKARKRESEKRTPTFPPAFPLSRFLPACIAAAAALLLPCAAAFPTE
jgi:hypothetical protein